MTDGRTDGARSVPDEWRGNGGMTGLRSPFPWFGDPMSFAKAHVYNGVLEVDNGGRIWRVRAFIRSQWRQIVRRRAENIGRKGYLRISLWVPRERRLCQVMAHNLVWELARGPIPHGLEVNHKDLCTSNNRLSNLELLTKSGNIQHSYDHGRAKPWSHAVEWRPGRFTLTAGQIEAIRRRRESGDIFKTIAADFGISITHAHRVCSEVAQ